MNPSVLLICSARDTENQALTARQATSKTESPGEIAVGTAIPLSPAHEDARGRFEAKYVVRPSGCWEWSAHVTAKGYGQFGFGGKGQKMLAHRFSFELYRGAITNEALDHLCRNRRCVNPGHLEAVSSATNTRRGMSPTAINGRRTHCLNGHLLAGEHLVVRANGKRRCRTCNLLDARLKRSEARLAKIEALLLTAELIRVEAVAP